MLLTSLLLLRYISFSSKTSGLSAAILYALAHPSIAPLSLSMHFLLSDAVKLSLFKLLDLPSLPSSILLTALRSALLTAFLNNEPALLPLNALASKLDLLLLLHGAVDPLLRSKGVHLLLSQCLHCFAALSLQD